MKKFTITTLLLAIAFFSHSQASSNEQKPGKKNNFTVRSPNTVFRIGIIAPPSLSLEQKIIGGLTVMPEIGLRFQIIDNASYAAFSQSLELRYYPNQKCKDKRFKICGPYIGANARNYLYFNNHSPSQEYLLYGGITGKLFWRVYGTIGLGFGISSIDGVSYFLISIPGSIGISL